MGVMSAAPRIKLIAGFFDVTTQPPSFLRRHRAPGLVQAPPLGMPGRMLASCRFARRGCCLMRIEKGRRMKRTPRLGESDRRAADEPKKKPPPWFHGKHCTRRPTSYRPFL